MYKSSVKKYYFFVFLKKYVKLQELEKYFIIQKNMQIQKNLISIFKIKILLILITLLFINSCSNEGEKVDKSIKVSNINLENNNNVEIEELYNSALLDFKKNNYTNSIKKFKKVLELKPKNKEALYYLWVAYRKNSLIEKSIKSLEKSLEIKKDYLASIYELASIYYNKKDYKKSLQYYKKLQKIDKNNNINYNIGLVYEALKNEKKAFEEYKIAYEKNSWNVKIITKLWLFYYKNNDKEKFLELYKKAIDIKPTYVLAWYNLSIFYKKERDKKREEVSTIVWKTLEWKEIKNIKLDNEKKNIIKFIKEKKFDEIKKLF